MQQVVLLPRAVSILLEMKADVDQENKSGLTAFGMLIDYKEKRYSEADSKPYFDTLKILLDYKAKADINLIVKGSTLLMDAVKRCYFGLVDSLLKRGADVNWTTSDKVSALHAICAATHSFSDKLPIIQALLLAGADCSLVNIEGKKALDLLTEENQGVIKGFLAQELIPILTLFFPVTLIHIILKYYPELDVVTVKSCQSSAVTPMPSAYRSQSFMGAAAQREIKPKPGPSSLAPAKTGG